MSRAVAALLYQVEPWDAAVLIGAVACVVLVATDRSDTGMARVTRRAAGGAAAGMKFRNRYRKPYFTCRGSH